MQTRTRQFLFSGIIALVLCLVAVVVRSQTGSTGFVDTTVQPSTTYYYVVTATDAAGDESAFSNQFVAAVPAGTTKHFVVISWTASTSTTVTGYRVYRGIVSGGPYSFLVILAPPSSLSGVVQ